MIKIGPPARRQRVIRPHFWLHFIGVVFLAWLGLGDARAQTLGMTSLLVGPAAGTNSVVLSVVSPTTAWTAAANTNWLSLSAANQSGIGGTNVVFTFAANANWTRSGTLTIAGQTLTVTQAGSNYVPAGPVTAVDATSLNDPYGVAVDGAGNVYIADSDNNAIKEWSPSNNMVVTLVASNAATPLYYPYGVAVDVAGNVYIADTGHSAIKEWTAATSIVTNVVSTGLLDPYGLAVDGAGNIYIADTYNSAIKKWSAATRTVTTLVSSGLNEPRGVAVDAAGNVYIADTENGAIKKWTASTGTVITLVSSGLAYPSGLAVDGGGNVYIADTYDSVIKKWPASGSGVTNLVSTGLFYPFGVAVDGARDIYLADTLDDAIKEVPHAFVNPAPKVETQDAGNDSLPGVLPATANLLPPFAPTATANWLSISGVTNDVISFSFTINTTGSNRMADITVLGQNIPVTQNAQAPSISNLSASDVTSSNATLNASVNPEGPEATVYFVFGVTTNYDGTNILTDIGGGTNPIPVNTLVTGILPNTVYHFEAIAVSGAGTNFSGDSTFTTLAGAPTVAFESATDITNGTATLIASVNPEGAATSVFFVYGPGANYGGTSVTTSIGSGTSAIAVSSVVTGLLSDTLYHFRALAINSAGTNYGGDMTFSNGYTLAYSLGATSLVTGPAAGTNSVVLAVNPQGGTWNATNNAPWLHLATADQSGAGSANVIFSYDLNSDAAPRVGTLTIAGLTLTVTQAGSDYVAAQPITTLASSGLADPLGMAVDLSGNVYFADTGSNAIMKWTAANNAVTTLVPSGLNQPWGVAVDASGNVYIADSGNNAIKIWTAATGTVTNLVSAGLLGPRSVAVDGAGNVYIANTGSNTIVEWPVAGTNLITLASSLHNPSGVAVDAAGNVYIANTGAGQILEWSPAVSNLTTLVSSNLSNPSGVAVDGSGNVYIADTFSNSIGEWSAATGNLLTLVSNRLAYPFGVAVDGAGNVYIANTSSNAIEEMPFAFVDTNTVFESNAAGSDQLPAVLPASENLNSPFAPASDASWLAISPPVSDGVVDFSFSVNTGLSRTAQISVLGRSVNITQYGVNFLLGTTNLLEAPTAGSDSVVLAVNPSFGSWTAGAQVAWLHVNSANQSGVGGMNIVFSYDANPGATRQGAIAIAGQTLAVTQAGSNYLAANPLTALVSSNLNQPYAVALDAGGNVYIADSGDASIKEWMAADNSTISLVSGGLSNPRGVAVDAADNVYISDYANSAIYELPVTNQVLTPLVSSDLFNPSGIALDASGNIYVADSGDLAIKEYLPANGSLNTLVSSGLIFPSAVAVDAAGNVYIADTGNNAIKKWTAANSNVTVLVSGLAGPSGVVVDGSGNVFFADTGNNAIKKWTAASGNVTTLVPGLTGPAGVAVDGLGNVFLANTGGSSIAELPYAFVVTNAIIEGNAAGEGALPGVLPPGENLLAPFAPSSGAGWLIITGVTDGVVNFSYSATTSLRAGYISLLGQSIPITQAVTGTPPLLTGLRLLSNGVLQFSFTNNPNASFSVLSSTNLSLPLSEWTVVANMLANSNGTFQFTSPPATNNAQLFYVVRSP